MTDRAEQLLSWYGAHRRTLPWRAPPGENADPYAVLVSELMCQQTRVETVVPYFERWLQRWPSLSSLAAADIDDVRAMWTGLGYYRRARNLLSAARQAVACHGGLPADVKALRDLPGVGPYTAGAVASLAFGIPAALVDGNVSRVLARWFALESDVSTGAGRADVWRRAEVLMQAPRATADPGTWNQALMELGATVCTPSKPGCAVCPVATLCEARRTGRELQLPAPRKRAKPVAVRAEYAVITHRDAVLLAKRPENGRWPGLWEPPGCEGEQAKQQLETLLNALGQPLGDHVSELVHTLTHRVYTVSVRSSHAAAQRAPALVGTYTALQWRPIEHALGRRSGVSRLGQRVIEAAMTAVQVAVKPRN
jgi:A/G-specific adenine glycosylase